MATIDDDLARSVTEAFRLSQLDILNQDKLLTGPDDVEIELASGKKVKGPSWPKISKLATDADPDNKQPKNATLTVLAALVGAANKLPYFNGADTAALTNLTQVGRDIIGKNAIADVLQYLGLDLIDQDTNETRIWSPDKKSFILIQNGMWGTYSTNTPAGGVALGLGFGGTGAKDAAGARSNFGLGDSATKNVGTTAGTVAAGNDSRITGAIQKSQNGADIPDKAAFLLNLGFLSGKTATGGWVRLQGGFLFQWGRIENASDGSGIDVYFPTPFTEAPAYTFGVTSSSCDVYVCEGPSETKLNKVRCISYENKMSDKAGYFMAAGF